MRVRFMRGVSLALLCLLAAPVFGQVAYYWNILGLDQFTYSNGNLSGNGNWIAGLTGVGFVTNIVVSNTIECPATANDCSNQYNAVFPNDQCAQVQVLTLNTSGSVATLDVRSTTSGARSAYETEINGPLGSSANLDIIKYVSGTHTTLVAPVTETLNSGDLVGICAQGTTIYVTIRGTKIAALSTTDSSMASGVPAVGIEENGQLQTDAVLDNWSGFYLGTTIISSGGGGDTTPFPRLGAQLISGNQCMPAGTSSANDSIVAQFQSVIIGGNFDNWATTCSARTRFAIVAAIKGFTKTGVHAVLPKVFNYQNPTEVCIATCSYGSGTPWFGAWATAISCNNWYAYITNNSGTKVVSKFSSGLNVVDPAHVVGTDGAGCTNTGLFPFALMSSLEYAQFFAGTSGTVSAASNLDGPYFDNESIQALSASNGDWLRNGTSQQTNGAGSNTTAINATVAGKADIFSWWAANAPSYTVAINTGSAAELASPSIGGLGLTTAAGYNNLSGKSKYPMEQFMWGSFNTPNNVCTGFSTMVFLSFANTVSWYQLISSYSSTATPLLTGCVNPGAGGSGLVSGSDAQLVRYSLGMTLVAGNGYAYYGTYTQDIDDYAQSIALPSFDEFWGGTSGPAANTAGWLGQPVDLPQTAAYSNGIWVRKFTGGLVAVNGTGTGMNSSGCIGGSSGTITLPAGTWYPLHGANSVNPGGSAVTTLTLGPCDGRMFTTTGPNLRPFAPIYTSGRLGRHAGVAANDPYFGELLKDAI